MAIIMPTKPETQPVASTVTVVLAPGRARVFDAPLSRIFEAGEQYTLPKEDALRLLDEGLVVEAGFVAPAATEAKPTNYIEMKPGATSGDLTSADITALTSGTPETLAALTPAVPVSPTPEIPETPEPL